MRCEDAAYRSARRTHLYQFGEYENANDGRHKKREGDSEE
jgi:hypothetical protein